ncbi:hypothetical protein GQ54DRAFT_298589 [Martensiomyces pterosporus]|nr:hypothetical protein GQ54DRAFT_298589 [Martensiomyces pterosporus]
MSPTPLLPFQRQILNNLLDEDALCVVARGLGLDRILAELSRVCATPRALVFLLHASEQDETDLQHQLMQMRSGEDADQAAEMRVVKNETSSSARAQLYRQGGLLSVTSRILIADLLNSLVPAALVTGVIVHNASRITAESIEAFVLRVLRQQNPQTFVKALSDAPEAFTLGFAPLEKTLKVLGLRHVHLWPRFHVSVQEDLAKASTPVVEFRQPLTRAMVELQQAALDCVSATISELSTSSRLLDPEQINVESSLFRYFDAMVKRQLAPYWHRLSARVRGMVTDLASLRRVTELITSYDCVSLQRYLDTLLLSSKPGRVSGMGMRGPSEGASWLASDSANILFSVARSRAFHKHLGAAGTMPEETKEKLRSMGLPDNIVPVLEVPPKLRLLARVLDEVGVANHAALGRSDTGKENIGPVLIMASASRTCCLIRSYLQSMSDVVSLVVPATGPDDKNSNGEVEDSDSAGARTRTDCHPRMMVDLLRGFFRWKSQTSAARPSAAAAAAAAATTTTTTTTSAAGLSWNQTTGSTGPSTSKGSPINTIADQSQRSFIHGPGTNRRAPPTKRRRMRGASTAVARLSRAPADVLEQETFELASNIAANQHGSGATVLELGLQAGSGRRQEQESDNSMQGGVAEAITAEDDDALGDHYLGEDEEWAEALAAFDEHYAILSSSETVVVQAYSGASDSGLLQSLCPTHIIMYDPDPTFIRQVEIYQALHPGILKQVYFLVYDNSLEEQRYLSTIRRERESFEKLIHEKSVLVIPIDSTSDGRGSVGAQAASSPGNALLQAIASRNHRNARDLTRSIGAIGTAIDAPRVVVDVREFWSPLPSLLHASGFNVVPRTIDVGDYVLHDGLVIERKSLPDLIGSLRSGRLFNQAKAMTTHYACAALLIEFEVNTSFSLQAIGGIGADIAVHSINSQLAMLVLAFPRLRIIWSSSPYETVNIFAELKKDAGEPDTDRAVAVGQGDQNVQRESVYNQAPINLLQSVPGITLKNYQTVARRYRNFQELCLATKDDLKVLLGEESATQLHGFLHARAGK